MSFQHYVLVLLMPIICLRIVEEILSKDWIVFGVVSLLFFGLLLETSIANVSGFESIHNATTDIPLFSVLGVFSLISQIIILNFVHKKINGFAYFKRYRLDIIFKAMVLTQLAIGVLLAITLFEITLTFTYHLILLKALFLISSITAIGIMILLSSRFIIWLRSNRSKVTLVYLLASSSLSLTVFIGVVYVLDQLSYEPEVIHPKPYGEFVLYFEVGDSTLAYAFAISSAVSFTLLWIGTVLLLRGYRKKLGTTKYWIIMSVPLLYFLSQFEPSVLNVLSSNSLSPILFSIIYVIVVIASTPVGSILFGLSFVQIARKVQHPEVKSYMIISAIGLLLLLVSSQSQVLITAPFPPFGLLSNSFLGLSCYLIFIGIYSSAVSISQDSRLRTSIRRSVEDEVSFIGNIGNAQMDHTIKERVLETTRRISGIMPEETGIASSLTEKEISEYIEQVLQEIQVKERS
jgi:hypothetical protein